MSRRGGNRLDFQLVVVFRAKGVDCGEWACQFSAQGLVVSKCINVGYGIAFVEQAHHAGSVHKGLGYALCVYLLHSEFPNQHHVKHLNRQFS